ncbi:TetR/AcrR family transcriptional regulator [Hoyosella sp. YIM 151337]|uniref:TetR/AcrR family transcriptional regulator n=1 Tax=Hoyosella sp. YIM 151337 TaxID=2992742 RepID=UPI0022365A26|nr:TetR/AcrR family transcriptional regulator [Hoyosella sp. YIM 151337]MCW4353567.1 TetR/AcrR family transcriptional regulator [Hoyosella sp. YIM 151337]
MWRGAGPAFVQDKTAELLEQAAAAVVLREGPLQGFSIRKIAEAAGVNRGLVYHYFGTGRSLISEALNQYVDSNLVPSLVPQTTVAALTTQMLKAAAGRHDAFRALALLLLDGQPPGALLFSAGAIQRTFEREQQLGRLRADFDPAALYALLVALMVGYALLRRRLAAECKVSPAELDARIQDLAARITAS